MSRKRYRNGDEIALSCGCDGCSPSMINGVLCHESGCPDAWRDKKIKCFECGCEFRPAERFQLICEDCANIDDDFDGDIDDARELDDMTYEDEE